MAFSKDLLKGLLSSVVGGAAGVGEPGNSSRTRFREAGMGDKSAVKYSPKLSAAPDPDELALPGSQRRAGGDANDTRNGLC